MSTDKNSMQKECEVSEQDEAGEHVGGRTEGKSATVDNRRRSLLGAAGAGAAAGLLAGTATGALGGQSNQRLTVDVACLGPTARLVALPDLGNDVRFFDELEDSDLRGSSWYVEGWMYPEGTIAGGGFVPTETDRIGVWLCRGNFMVSPVRADPHLASVHEYYFDDLEADPIGRNLVISQGLEGRNEPDWRGERAVTGGTGDYRGARGIVLQHEIAKNSTMFPDGRNAASFRFNFDLQLL